MSQHTDEVENLELQLEEYFSKSTTPFLMEFGKAAGIADMGDGVRRTGVLRTLRKLVATAVGDTDEETADHLGGLVDIFESLKEDVARSANAAATDQLAGGAKLRPRESSNADPMSDLARLLRDSAISGDAVDDKASIFRRQLKITGVIGSAKENITYLNLLSQVADAKASNYSPDDICRAIRKSISGTSTLRTYFDTQLTMDLSRMLGLLRDFYQERTASELFQELGRLLQQPGEGSTDFIFRGFELRQKVIMASQAEGGSYNEGLVNETFRRSVRTGLTDANIRTRMDPLLDPRAAIQLSDEQLLSEVNVASAVSAETASKHKALTKKVTVAEAVAVKTDATADLKATLQEGLATLQKQINELQHNAGRQTTRSYQRRDRDFRCRKCRDANSERCTHCFHCGDVNHLARDCASK